jgi:hypothetical protein
MSRQQADNAGEQIEEQADQNPQVDGKQTERGGAKDRKDDRKEIAAGHRPEENAKRVQYGQGYSKDHPSKPGTDTHLASGAGPSSKDTPTGKKRSG